MISARAIPTPYVVAYPRIENVEDLRQVRRLTDWNLAPWAKATGGRIILPVSENLLNSAHRKETLAEITALAPKRLLHGATRVLGWNSAALTGASPYLRTAALAIDPFMDISATDTINRFVSTQLQTSETVEAEWRQSLDILQNFAGTRDLLIVGSGPHSADARISAIRSGACPLILGTALMDTELIDSLPSGLIISADGPGQFSSMPAALTIISAMGKAIARGSHLVVTEELGPLARHLLGNIAPNHIHAVPMGGPLDALWRTSRTRPLANVLTTLGLPLAAVLALTGGNIQSLGVSFRNTPGPDPNASHWAHHNDALILKRKALDLLVHEPGSILPDPNYLLKHYANLRRMTDDLAEIGLDVPGRILMSSDTVDTIPVTEPSKVIPYIVAAVDKIEQWRHICATLTYIGIFLTVFCMLIALGPKHLSVLIVLSVAVLLGLMFLGIFLRLRIRRWMNVFERRRRQIESRELELIAARLDAIEDRLYGASETTAKF